MTLAQATLDTSPPLAHTLHTVLCGPFSFVLISCPLVHVWSVAVLCAFVYFLTSMFVIELACTCIEILPPLL
jgi:hypothetical protein